MTHEKVRENRLRRMAARQGLALRKSRRRDPRAVDHGKYCLVEPFTGAVVAGGPGGGFGLTLEEAARALMLGPPGVR